MFQKLYKYSLIPIVLLFLIGFTSYEIAFGGNDLVTKPISATLEDNPSSDFLTLLDSLEGVIVTKETVYQVQEGYYQDFDKLFNQCDIRDQFELNTTNECEQSAIALKQGFFTKVEQVFHDSKADTLKNGDLLYMQEMFDTFSEESLSLGIDLKPAFEAYMEHHSFS